MRRRCSPWLLLILSAAAAPLSPAFAVAPLADVAADPPSDLSVTIYRAPARSAGGIDVDSLDGFALVSESRTVHLPAGESRLRFEGVADGIEPASSIITGLPEGILEKNRAGALLSPSALVAATVGRPVELLRTRPKTGTTEVRRGRILADADDGVVFETADGIEALRCSGLPETFRFEGAHELSAKPTLSVLVESSQAMTATVTLSYLARGFDWAADYTATLAADEATLDLGAWVTLANGNGTGFPSAHIQVVAGRLNREKGEVEPIDFGNAIVATCWPRGSTSDPPELLRTAGAVPTGFEPRWKSREGWVTSPIALMEMSVTAQRQVMEEQLGDLKLYRLAERTTVASRQSKQVRLLDRRAIPVKTFFTADLSSDIDQGPEPASRLLRTTNDAAHHLGLPLPSGHVEIFGRQHRDDLLESESTLRDLALNEEVEINLGASPDVTVKATREKATDGDAHELPLLGSRVVVRSTPISDVHKVEIRNARQTEARFELRLSLPDGARIVRADHPPGVKNGRPLFSLTIAPHSSVKVRYQTQRVDDTLKPR